ncbi:helicase [Roseibium sp. TrichSKD4]|nr:helicase [Roseibium sp. TrichSKD4]
MKLDAASKLPERARRVQLLKILDELMSQNLKALVFSQLIKILHLIETDVRPRG